MPEQQAAITIKTVIKALIHCHSNGIAHRDIKLENIMFGSDQITDYSDIQLIDFGVAIDKAQDSNCMHTIVGKCRNSLRILRIFKSDVILFF